MHSIFIFREWFASILRAILKVPLPRLSSHILPSLKPVAEMDLVAESNTLPIILMWIFSKHLLRKADSALLMVW